MATWLRRVFWLGLIGGAGYGGWLVWQGRTGDEEPVPEWPPLDPPAPPVASTDEPVTSADEPTITRDEVPRWAEPVDGRCPEGYPIKANANSGIFHVPGGRFYERTVPERCYADAADAEADGYRRAKA